MNFLNGYIIFSIITGLISLGNHLWKWKLDVFWIVAPVMFYILASVLVLMYKQSKKE